MDKIYLQVQDGMVIDWCKYRMNDTDIEYVKAPKNELQKLDEKEIYSMSQYYCKFDDQGNEVFRFKDFARDICSKFGFSGNASTKEFSTAEVSLEAIEKALSPIPSTHFPISKMNGKHYYYMCKEDIAKAIKAELEGK